MKMKRYQVSLRVDDEMPYVVFSSNNIQKTIKKALLVWHMVSWLTIKIDKDSKRFSTVIVADDHDYDHPILKLEVKKHK